MQTRAFYGFVVLAAGLMLTGSSPAFAEEPAGPDEGGPVTAPIEGEMPARPGARIDVVFAIDSTGSMGSAINLAKAEMARIISALRKGDPTPDVRFGILTYRDKGDRYRVRYLPLTRDLSAAYSYMLGIEAGGGGDWPESVSYALLVAVDEINWDYDRNTARVVFLIGDAPPHMDYSEPDYHVATARARAKTIIINTIATNSDKEVEKHWSAIAAETGGEFSRFEAGTGAPLMRASKGSKGVMVGSGSRGGLHEGLTRDELGPEGAGEEADADAEGAPKKSSFGDLVIEGSRRAAAKAAGAGTTPTPKPATGKGKAPGKGAKTKGAGSKKKGTPGGSRGRPLPVLVD